nr:hypothetical protein [Tanacetum cinerariifolium]
AAGAPIEAHALAVRLHDLTTAVEVKFVRIEDVVHQDGRLAEGDADVHTHRDLRHDAGHLVHELVEYAGEVLVVGQVVDGPGHAVVRAQGVAEFDFGLHIEQQGASFFLFVEVDGDIKMPGL